MLGDQLNAIGVPQLVYTILGNGLVNMTVQLLGGHLGFVTNQGLGGSICHRSRCCRCFFFLAASAEGYQNGDQQHNTN